MKIEVKGHSGCQIDVVNEGNEIYVYKSTADPKYIKRLVLQAEKQRAAAEIEHQHIRVPKIYDIEKTDETVVVKMQYVYSKNFIEFFEQAGFEQVDYLIGALSTLWNMRSAKASCRLYLLRYFKISFPKSNASASTIHSIRMTSVLLPFLAALNRSLLISRTCLFP